MWLMESSLKETRRTSSPIMEPINSTTNWEVGDKDSIINKEEMEFRRVSLFDVSKRIMNIVQTLLGFRSIENELTFYKSSEIYSRFMISLKLN